jgi:flavodoxin I
MSKIALIYSFNTQKSKKVAEKIKAELGDDKVEAINAETINKSVLETHDNFILSAPTWFDGELPNYWDEFMPDLEEMDLKEKKFAIFGLGDQKGYPENFCDAIGLLAEVLEECGATVVGETSVEGYTFESSKAQRGDLFIGLPLDQENQARLTGERIKKWLEELNREFN